ncbi:MAG TPA: hypothetical protein VI704_00820 [Bacteroidota bacterium]|nr:hypothetical protein [Bacteroidota bacterium]
MPRVTLGLDFDYVVSDRSALMGGVSAHFGSGRRLTAAYGGYGYLRTDTAAGFRWDVGVQYLNTTYAAATVLVRTTSYYDRSVERDVQYFFDQGEESHVNVFVSLTFNSTKRNSFMNWFFQIAISPQTLTSFPPRLNLNDPLGINYSVSDERAESSVFWVSMMPGVTFALTERSHVLLGTRLMADLQFDSSKSPSMLILPVLQVDWSF